MSKGSNDSDMRRIRELYEGLAEKHDQARRRLGRALILSEKILYSHLECWPAAKPVRGVDTLQFEPDRVAMQDATAQMAMLQFMVAGLDESKIPATIHCDHLIRARSDSGTDLAEALEENREVYDFLRSAAARYGIGFWQPGSGIIHQVVLEQYAFPGGMMIGTDSHTPNAGGLGMLAIGVGGADAVDVMAGLPWGLLNPKLIGIRLTGKLSGWTAPKDVILQVAARLSVKGGTGRIVEYFGPGARSISCTGKATITNMGAELGATTSIFPFDEAMFRYLSATGREEVAELAMRYASYLAADAEVEESPGDYFDEVIEIDLSELEPQWVGPHTPDLLHKASQMREAVRDNGYPDEISAALIGSCTNSSYEDIGRAACIAKQAVERGIKSRVPLLVTPGSDQVYQTVKRDGFLEPLLQAGAVVLANACGPCIGQWKREGMPAGRPNTIVTSYNRNFRKRNDNNPDTFAFIGSPELVTAAAFAGRLSFDPVRDSIQDASGKEFRFTVPAAAELPEAGFALSRAGFIAGSSSIEERRSHAVIIDPGSERLAELTPFAPWRADNFRNMVLLLKARGKCTTDHISQAGPWLKYRGHLPNISKNLFLGAVNAFNAAAGSGKNVVTGETGLQFAAIAADYKRRGIGWIVVGDENYGEGSSREHAAMEPRYLGCSAVIAKSFARIHETNLKKQGLLPLTFVNPEDYDLIGEEARFDLEGFESLAPGSEFMLRVKNQAGECSIRLRHTLTAEQVQWIKAGSALNHVRQQAEATGL